MAKLNVEVLDMANGEITKIAYEGAEYAKVGGISSDVISEGDIAYVKTSRTAYFDAKSFYEFIEHADNGNYVFKDNYGHRTGISSFNDRAVIFRKISTDSPTLEQHVSALESEVTALKGETITFEGAEYRKVDREAREGDVVTYASPAHSYVTKGKPYKVLSRSRGLRILDEDGDELRVYNEHSRTRETVDVYEPIEQAVKDASKPKLKAGDFVKFKRGIHDTKAGKPYLIEVDPSDGELSFKDDAGDFCDIDFTGEYEILSAEEAKWAKIGRKPNEFKKGDVVKARTLWIPSKDINDHIGIIEDEGYEMVGIKFGNGRYCGAYTADGNVELIATVESLFNA